MAVISRAILSVSDKTSIVEFAQSLLQMGVEILSTGGTAKHLTDNNVPVTFVSDFTGSPEILSGRVKSLHPKIHGGILARRNVKEDMIDLEKNDIQPIDLVCVNLYPFREASKNKDATTEEIIEEIDVGGPTLIRAGAKNFQDVAVIVDHEDYNGIIKEMQEHDGSITEETCRRLSLKAFTHSASYDACIQDWLRRSFFPDDMFPETLVLSFDKQQDLRYGENPYQDAAFYYDSHIPEICVTNARQLHGKKLSFNNILDINDAFELIKEFDEPTVAIIKHTNPCGVASRDNIHDAYIAANEADSMSAFGGVIAINRPCDKTTADAINSVFVEAVIAPSYDSEALDILKEKKNIRLLETGQLSKDVTGYDLKKVVGGLLVQTRGYPSITESDIKIASEREPTKEELEWMLYAWKINRHIKSNSILFCSNNRTVGIGAGQMSRVDAVKIASFKAGDRSKGAVMASDAFFPFRDGVDEAAEAGITAVIQPGGSIRDSEVIEAVNEHGMAMVFTGVRAFRH